MNPTILIVDDELIIALSIKKDIKEVCGDDFEFLVASNSEDALEIIKKCMKENKNIDIMTSGYMMPGMKGPDLIIAAHELVVDTDKIIICGYYDPETLNRLVQEKKIRCYFYKPWDTNVLKNTIKNILIERGYSFINREE